MGLGSVAGQILGGLLVSLDVMSLGWRAVFLAMAPAALICFAIGWVFIPAGRPERTQGLAQCL
jgi:MFS family permease